MKKTLYIILTICMALCMLFAVGCGDSAETPSNPDTPPTITTPTDPDEPKEPETETPKEPEVQEPSTFAGITFEDKTVTYNGEAHSLEIKGVPSFASVSYDKTNSFTNAGEYTVKATVTATNYTTKTLTAKLIIKKATVSGIAFNGATYTYDGTAKSLAISGMLPSGVTVDYTNNGKTNAGTYTVTANFSVNNNYNEIAPKTAELKINKATFTGLGFANKTETYNGQSHSLTLTGKPDFASVSYDKTNSFTNAGEYTVKATITADNYETKELTAKLTINKATYDMSGVTYVTNRTYNGKAQTIDVNGLPNGVTAHVEQKTCKNAGTYPHTISFTGDSTNYNAITSVSKNLIIAQKELTIAFDGQRNLEYTGTVQKTISAMATNLEQGDSVEITLTYSGAMIEDGEYTVTASINDTNYKLTKDNTVEVTISRGNHTVTLVDSSGQKQFTIANLANANYLLTQNTPKQEKGYTVTWKNVDLSCVIEDVIVGVDKTPIIYTITYINDGKSVVNTTEYDIEDVDITLNNPENANGMFFDGWYNSANQKVTVVDTDLADDITLTAKYIYRRIQSAEGFDIDYTGLVPTISVVVDNSVTEFSFENAFIVNAGCAWKLYNDNNCQNENTALTIALNEGNNLAYVKVTYNGDETIRYTVNVYRKQQISYTFQDGISTPEIGFVVEGETVNAPTNPNKNGYTFSHWEVNGETVAFPYVIETETVFVAKYNTIDYNITYVLNNGELNTTLNTFTIESNFALPRPTKQYYTFAGWYLNAGFTGEPIENIPTGRTSDLTVYAKWTEMLSGLSFIELEDGEFVYDQATERYVKNFANSTTTVDFNSRISVNTGFTWKLYPNANGQQEWTFKEVPVSEGDNYVYIALWHPLNTSAKPSEQYLIVVHRNYILDYSFTNRFAGTESGTVEEGKMISKPQDYEKYGYTFDGWTVNGELVSFPYVAKTNVTFVAKYTAIEKTLTYHTVRIDENGQEIETTEQKIFTIESLPFNVKAKPSLADYTAYGWGNAKTSADLSQLVLISSISSLEDIDVYSYLEYGTDGVNYQLNGTNDAYIVTGYTGSSSRVVIAPVHFGLPVTHIGASAFSGLGISEIVLTKNLLDIGDHAFHECKDLTKIYYYAENMPDMESYIRFDYAGQNQSGITLYIGDKVKTIPAHLFFSTGTARSAKITSVVFEETSTLERIGKRAFAYLGGITSLTLPNSLTTVKEQAFEGMIGLTEIVIPENVTEMGSYVFMNCDKLNIYVQSQNRTNWHSKWFYKSASASYRYYLDFKETYIDWQGIKYVLTTKGEAEIMEYTGSLSQLVIDTANGYPVKEIPSGIFEGKSFITKVTVGESVEKISAYAFSGCSSLEMVVIGDNLSVIGDYAFYDCSMLSIVQVGSGIKKIGASAFKDCVKATNITFEDGNNEVTVGAETFYNCSKLIAFQLPSGIVSIGVNAFYNCGGLTTREINGVEYLGTYNYQTLILVKANDTTITSCEIPNLTMEISANAFSDCSSLQSITIPNSVKSIGSSAFYNCSNLTTIVIPSSVAKIGSYAFNGCSQLTIYCEASSTPTDWHSNWNYSGCSVFWNFKEFCIDNGFCFVILNNGEAVLSAYIGNDTQIVVQNTVNGYTITSISDNAFANCTAQIIWGDNPSIQTFGYAFKNYLGTTLTIPNSVIKIEEGALYGCSNLESIALPFVGASLNGNSNTHFGYIFGAGSSSYNSDYVPNLLKTVVITGGESIGSGAFYNCSSLTSITIPNSVTSIGDSAFYNCSSLTSITIPNSVTSIGLYAFEGCSSLESITIPNSVTSIGSYAFSGCGSLKTVTFGENSELESIGSYAFEGCSGLQSITIPSSVTSIGDRAFYGCSSLEYNEYENGLYLGNSENQYLLLLKAKSTSITSCEINSNTKLIYYSAFIACSNLESITIPNSVTSIGDRAFYGCSSLQSINLPFVGSSKTATGYSSVFGYIFGYTTRSSSSWVSGTTYQYYYSYYGEYYHYYIPSSLKSVTITGGSINERAFYNCSGLTSITIPNSVTSIGDRAFSGCSSLTKVNYLGTIDQWAMISFNDNDSNPLYYAKNLYINDQLATNAVLTSATKISDYAFYNCSGLTSITIPSSVTSIGDSAFSGCDSLTSIAIPSSVTSIGDYAFSYCYDLESITVESGNTIYHSAGNSIIETASKTLVLGCKNSVIPTDGSVTSIGSGAFYGCSSLISITIPNTVTSIGSSAFYGCSGLNTIYYGGTSEQWSAISIYSYNTNLTNATRYYYSESEPALNAEGTAYDGNYWHYVDDVIAIWEIPAHITVSATTGIGFTTSGDWATQADGSLKSSSIGNSSSSSYTLTMTSGGTFTYSYKTSSESGYDKLTVYKNGTATNVSGVSGVQTSFTEVALEVVAGDIIKFTYSKDSSQASGDDAVYIKIGDMLPTLGGVFGVQNNELPNALTTITVDGDGKISNGYFQDCLYLTTIYIGNGVVSISDNAFAGCTALTSIYYNGSVDEWNEITIGENNVSLLNATIYYFSEEEPNFTDGNQYWRYVDGVPTAWVK